MPCGLDARKLGISEDTKRKAAGFLFAYVQRLAHNVHMLTGLRSCHKNYASECSLTWCGISTFTLCSSRGAPQMLEPSRQISEPVELNAAFLFNNFPTLKNFFLRLKQHCQQE